MADQIKVTFGAIDTAGTDMNTAISGMQQRMSQLRSDIAPMLSTWSGTAQQSYHQAQQQWDQGWQELTSALQELRRATDQANQGYHAGEQANKNRFPG